MQFSRRLYEVRQIICRLFCNTQKRNKKNNNGNIRYIDIALDRTCTALRKYIPQMCAFIKAYIFTSVCVCVCVCGGGGGGCVFLYAFGASMSIHDLILLKLYTNIYRVKDCVFTSHTHRRTHIEKPLSIFIEKIRQYFYMKLTFILYSWIN